MQLYCIIISNGRENGKNIGIAQGKIEVWMKGTLFYYEYASDYG